MQELNNISLKDHDESRQGKALMIDPVALSKASRKLYIESYGCAMNFADSDIVASIMTDMGFATTRDFKEADVIFINTCSIRENAEQRVRKRLTDFRTAKASRPGMLIGVLGCMAERLKAKFLEEEKLVDIVAGPDAYRDLPNLIGAADEGNRMINVLLSREETYADINPVRQNSNGIAAYVSIMRGCNNMCSFCVVPYTRGRERSRDARSIIKEAADLFENGYREVTLLGQNVDSYHWKSKDADEEVNFARLLEMVAMINPLLRVRFSTSHPKDITDEVIHTINRHDNICNSIHLPVQSGSSRILDLMNRSYSREWYRERIDTIKKIIPDCGISTDVITGFCSETEEDHKETLDMMNYVKYNYVYMFSYSERPGTPAAKKLKDDVPEEIKSRRLNEVIKTQQFNSHIRLREQVGRMQKVLIEGYSRKSQNDYSGRNDQNTMVVFPVKGNYKPGDYVNVLVDSCTPATLLGKIID